MLAMITAAFVVGLVVAMPPGPVTISTGQRAISRGFRDALTFNLGSTLADALYALMVYFGLAALLADSVLFRLGLWTLGGGWLIYLGLEAMRSRVEVRRLEGGVREEKSWQALRSGLLMTLFNPVAVISWIAIAGNFFMAWPEHWPPMEAVGLIAMAAMLVGALVWVVLLALIFSTLRRLLNPRLLRWGSIASGLFLVLYGLSAWWAALDLLL
ncbi:MAG: LysE family translocator [Chloroflexi bacterium]|nr:LysE family translocator [Chloroflexota bacterium]